MREYGDTLGEQMAFEQTNLIHVPKNNKGEVLTYIGSFTGYYFQAAAADNVYLFYDRELAKAVICFEYT